MKLTTPFGDPCACPCHDVAGEACTTPSCCHYAAVPREVAMELAARACRKHLNGDTVLCVLEINGHEHNLVTLSNLFDANDIKTLLKRTDLSDDADKRVNEEFMPATLTVLECCAPAARVQEMIEQSQEFGTIASVREI